MPTRYVGWFCDPVLTEVAGVAKSGANTVAMGPYCIMPAWNSSTVGTLTGSTEAEYVAAMQSARAKGLKIVLKPIIDCSTYVGDPNSAGWRAAINPANISTWMESYWTTCFQPYLALVDVIAIHTELVTVSALYPSNFIELIQEIKMAGFSGPITTSNDFDPLDCPYWTALDWMGADAYPTIRTDTLAHAVADWTVLAQQAAVANAQTGLNAFFGELCANIGVAQTSAQTALVYQAFWEVFGPLEYWAGAVGWRWPQNATTPPAALMAGLISGLAAQPSFTTPQADTSVGTLYVGPT
jgi:hypothetical protein